MKKIVCITGTRPQLVKHSVLVSQLEAHFLVDSLYTGQHYDYTLHEGLKKDLFNKVQFHNLQVLHAHEPAKRLAEMIAKIAAFLQTAKPHAVLVYGDTDTTLAGALAANKMNIKLIHVEAGERSFNRSMPEEHNRIVTDALADFLFCASYMAVKNLNQKKQRKEIIYSGDLMKDRLLQTAQLFQTPMLNEPYFFCTIHRNYTNHDSAKLQALLDVLAMLNEVVVFPVHPATQVTIESIKHVKGKYANIRFLPAVPYTDSIRYQKFAQAIITDSGGIQKEAYWLKRRCITIRKETEWTETLNGHWNQLAYDDLSQIPILLQAPLGMHDENLYGNGSAASCITKHLIRLL